MTDELRRAAEKHFEQGNRLDENGHREAAIKEWEEAVHLDPELAAAHFNLGIAYADEGEMDLAVNALRQAIHLDPFDVDARRELADIYLELDQSDEAVNQLRQALNIVPSDAETAHLLAQAYLDQGKWDEAAGALESGGMLEEDADLWLELASAYARENRNEDAILAYRRVLICQPEHRAAAQALHALHVPLEEPPDLSDEQV